MDTHAIRPDALIAKPGISGLNRRTQPAMSRPVLCRRKTTLDPVISVSVFLAARFTWLGLIPLTEWVMALEMQNKPETQRREGQQNGW